MTALTPRERVLRAGAASGCCERVLRAVNHQKPDRVPKDISWGFTPTVLETFRRQTGRSDPEETFGVEVRFVGMDLPS